MKYVIVNRVGCLREVASRRNGIKSIGESRRWGTLSTIFRIVRINYFLNTLTTLPALLTMMLTPLLILLSIAPAVL